ncbi:MULTISPECIES: hypothetical protein [unclassified Streptomyces]|uniref:hypothetical protein n=1 Tax=unclassified Streptomyces TaxID=2593676 RepID=UPI001655248F|nr:hypothetical protein [Streptomyces sp. CB02980]MCB8904607.1 hypothetical protein [Streptomyces sp. CB02980]
MAGEDEGHVRRFDCRQALAAARRITSSVRVTSSSVVDQLLTEIRMTRAVPGGAADPGGAVVEQPGEYPVGASVAAELGADLCEREGRQ